MKNRSELGLGLAAITVAGGLATGISYGGGILVDSLYGKRRAQEYVEQSGYTSVEFNRVNRVLVGFRGCGESDMAEYKFHAKAANGQEAKVIVCKGLLKGATIRQD